MEKIIYILVFIAGLVTFLGSVLNWESMYRSKRAKGIVSTFGIKGARIVYGIIGVVIMVGAVLGFTGVFSS